MSIELSLDTDYVERDFSSLKVLDYIPIVSTISGIVRIIFGGLETVLGLCLLTVQLIQRYYSQKRTPFLFVDGFANIIRGSIAAQPVVGNIVSYLYDYSSTIRRDIRRASGLD